MNFIVTVMCNSNAYIKKTCPRDTDRLDLWGPSSSRKEFFWLFISKPLQMFCSVWITISTSFPQRNVNDTEKLCLIKTIRNDQVLINYLRFLMTFRTIKADNGKFMGFDILGGLSRGRVGFRQKRVIRQLAANIKTWSENPQKGSPFNSDKCSFFTVKKFTNYHFVRIPMTGAIPWNILI